MLFDGLVDFDEVVLSEAMNWSGFSCRTNMVTESFAQSLCLSHWITSDSTHWHLLSRQGVWPGNHDFLVHVRRSCVRQNESAIGPLLP
jgi:hypothetical protein